LTLTDGSCAGLTGCGQKWFEVVRRETVARLGRTAAEQRTLAEIPDAAHMAHFDNPAYGPGALLGDFARRLPPGPRLYIRLLSQSAAG
jgi:hypothetical protein